MNSDSLWWRIGAGLVALALSLGVPLASGSEGPILEEIQFPGGMSAEFVRDENDVTVMDFSGNFDRYLEGTTPNNAARAVLAREFFQHHADDYDFLFYFSLFDYELNDAVAFHLGAQNAVQGIGLPVYDNTSVYGSEGRLLGTIDMGTAILDEAKTDPTSPDHEHLLVTTMHEMLHQWGIHVDFIDPETGERSSDLLGSDDAHWSSLVHTNGSVELGAKWLDNGDGTFTAVAERLFYSPLDLYLMGMASPDEVSPFFLVEDPEPAIDPDAVTALGKTVQGRRKNLTIQDIIAAEGPRQPSWQDAQTSFNTAFIIVKRPGQEVPPEVYGRINTLRETAAQRFSILTGGRGIMHVYSRVRPTSSVGEVDGAVGDAGERETAYDQADALDWLRSAQTAGGYWQDKSATALRDSLLAHDVLADLDPLYTDAGRNAFQAWFNRVAATDNDGRSRLATAGVPGAADVAGELVNAQRVDGGWGLSADHESSPVDTALVLRALSGWPEAAQATLEARNWLQSVQNADGGWGAVTGGVSEVATTARVFRALGRGADADTAGRATAWLAGRQNTDGSFGDDANAVVATAETLWALADGEALEDADVPAAVAFLKNRQGADGSWDSSVFNTALVVKALGRVQFGNWTVSDLSASAEELHDGQHLTLTATIHNDGNVPTPGTRVVLYLGDPENGGTVIDSVEIPAIATGAGVDVTFDWDSLGYTGDQEIHLVVDPDDLVGERTELDNGAYVPVTVTPPPEGVDLIAGNINHTPATVGELPTTAGLSAVVRNAGDTDAGTVLAEWWQDRNGQSQLLERQSLELAARSDVLLTTDYEWTDAGARTFRLALDPEHQVVEADESNNNSRLTKTPQDGLDLTVSGDDIQLLNTPAYGQTLDATVTVHNRGTTASPTFTVDLSLEGIDGEVPLDTVQMALAAGESRTLDVPWRVDRLGDFRLVARLDPGQQVAELSEDNNEAGKTFTASVVDGNNLQISAEDLVIEPQPLLEGYGASLTALVRNTGNQSAANVKVHFYDGKPGAGATRVAETTLPEVAPGTAVPAEAVWSRVDGSGERSVYVVVDPEAAIEEFDETDNSAFQVVQVKSLPDLALEAGAINLSPPLVAEGETFTATVRVANLGSQPVEAARVALYRGGTAEQDRIGEQTVAVEGNGQVSVAFSGVADSSGEQALHLRVDEGDSVEELREDNNAGTVTLVVQDGRFYIDNPFISPDGDGVRDSVTLVYRTLYPEGAYLSVESQGGSVVRKLPLASHDGGSLTWTGRNDAGGIVDDGRYSLILRASGGGELDAVSVVVDNNRSTITDSLLEKDRGYLRNLTCNLPNDPIFISRWLLAEDEQSLFFDKNAADEYPGAANGIYHSDFSGQSLERLASRDSFSNADEIRLLARSNDGSRVAYAVSLDLGSGFQPVEIYERRLDSEEPPKILMSLESGAAAAGAYGGDNQTLYVIAAGESLSLYNATSGALLKDYGIDSRYQYQYQAELVPNRDGSRMLVNVSEGEGSYIDQQIIDLLFTDNGSVTPIGAYGGDDFSSWSIGGSFYSADDYFCDEGGEAECASNPAFAWRVEAVWAPSGSRFSLAGRNHELYLHNADGVRVDTFTLPRLAGGVRQLTKSLTWSSDGDKLAFFYGGGYQNDGLFAGGYVHVLDTASGEAVPLWPFYANPYANDGTTSESRVLQAIDRLLFLPSDDAILYQDNDGSQVISFRGEPALHDVVADLGRDVTLSPRGRSLIYRDTPEQQSCNLDDQGDTVEQLYGFDTLDNLTVSLRALRSADVGAFRIHGTVTDRNFDRYSLEFSANGSDGWRPIKPDGTSQYVDEVMTSWVPPEPGRYFVRLTGIDKAGNRASAMQQVVWSEQSPITDIYLDQDLFSPNADGTLDQVGVHFRVRSPINLPVHIYSGEDLIRSYQGAYDTIGEEVWLYWDGRDENGRIVPDGEYRIEILGIEYWVTIDNTYPELNLGMSPSPYGAECLRIADLVLGSIYHLSAYDTTPRPVERQKCKESASYRGQTHFLTLDYLLRASASDRARELSVRLESADPGQNNWTLLAPEAEAPRVPLGEQQIVERKFRASAVDAAGNTSVKEYRPARGGLATVLRMGPLDPDGTQRRMMGPEFVLLGEPVPADPERLASGERRFGPVPNIGAPAHITLSETLEKEVVAVQAEYRDEGQTEWHREPVTDFLHADWARCKETAFNDLPQCAEPVVSPLIPDHRIHLRWDMAVMPSPWRSKRVRFVLVTADNAEVATPEVIVSPRLFGIGEFGRSDLLPQADIALTGSVYSVEKMERISVHVQSDEDDSYASERLLGTVFPADTVSGLDGSLFALDASDLMYCRTYRVRAVMTQPDGVQNTKQKTLRTPCMQLLYRVEYPDSLDDPDNGRQLDIIVWPVSRSEVPLKSLQLFAPLPDGSRDVVATRNQLENSRSLRLPVDLSAWPTGRTELALRLVDEQDNETVETVSVYKDVAAPDLQLAYPLEGDLVCGAQPFQIYYEDGIGSTGGTLPDGWNHSGGVQVGIDQRGGSFSLVYGSKTDVRLPASDFLGAVNMKGAALANIAQLLSGEPLTHKSSHAELIVEALALDGSVAQRFPLWDRNKTPVEDYPSLEGPREIDGKLVYRDLVTLPWQPDDTSGDIVDVELRITGTDAVGNRSVLNRGVRMDVTALTPEYRIDQGTEITVAGGTAYISPNGDGVRDSLTVRTTNYEAGTLELRLYEGMAPPQGEDYQVLSRRESATPGEYSHVWDGTLNGSPLTDGTYRIEPVLVDGCGNSSRIPEQGVTLVVDTTAPVIGERRPAAGDPLGLLAELRASVTEAHLDFRDSPNNGIRYRPAGSADEVGITRQIHETGPGQHDITAEWNTYGLSGDYELVWRLRDLAGNTAETVVPVVLREKADLLSGVKVDTPRISPNGDENRDRLRYRVTVLEPVDVTVTVTDGAGTPVSDILSATLQPGENTLSWNGETPGGVIADGRYRLLVSAVSREFTSLTQTVETAFVVDTVAPEIDFPGLADGLLQVPHALTASITDDAPEQYSVTLTGGGVETVLAEGAGGLAETTLANLSRGFAEGDYRVSAEASDLAGNRTKLDIPFILDLTPPVMSWLAPRETLVGGPESADLSWALSLEDAHPGNLEVSLADDQGTVTSLHSSEGRVGSIEGTANTGGLNGTYTLAAVAMDGAGAEARIEKTLELDHQAPDTTITVPADGDYITGDFAVEGRVDDANLVRWTLTLRDATDQMVETLADRADPVESQLGSYPAPADGKYRLVLEATDAVGFVSRTGAGLTVDTQPPAAPAGLAVTEIGAGEYRLTWSPSSSQDVAHYRVLDRGQDLGDAPLPETSYSFTPAENDGYRFTVVAVDNAGLVSEPSPALDWVLDTEGPAVALSSPANGDTLSGLVDVVGSVAAEDLESYSLASAPLASPEKRRAFAGSSLARSGEKLGQWNTLDEAADGDHLLYLTARDSAGNETEQSVTVSLDNTAPEAPENLQASVSGDDVDLGWDASASTDVQGYLLMRNDRIVNAEGPVVGEITPYLIEGLGHLDESVADGSHHYSVHAVDTAGNISAPASASVELDNRAPVLAWAAPDNGDAFENNLALRASSDDEDIAVVRFRYRAAGESVWTELTPDLSTRPWVLDWQTESLPYESHELQAQAWDEGGRTGRTAIITVSKQDLTPPVSPPAVAVSIEEEAAQLSWDASTSDDLASYRVTSVRDAGEIEVGQVSAPQTSLTVSSLEDGTHRFRVRAVDTSGNQSAGTESREAPVFVPRLDVYEGITGAFSVALSGTTPLGETARLYQQNETDRTLLSEVPVSADGAFNFGDVPLSDGENTFSVQVVSEEGDLSRLASPVVVRALTPGKVRNLDYEFPVADNTKEVTLSWEPPLNAPDALYLIRDASGDLLLDRDYVRPVDYYTDASYSWNERPYYAFDDRENTDFRPYDTSWNLDLVMEETTWVSFIGLYWLYEPVSVRVHGRVAGVWKILGELHADDFEDKGWAFAPQTPQPVDQLRFEVTGGSVRPGLLDVFIEGVYPGPDTSFNYLWDEREDASFSVSAVTSLGVEGTAKNLDVRLGDWQAPEAVTLTGQANASDVLLSWTASASSDVDRYLIYRGAEPVADVPAATLSYTDTDLVNGTYEYHVRPLDQAGNLGDSSNVVPATVSTELPESPSYVDAVDDALSGCIDVTWSESADASHYRVFRSEDGGDPVEIASVTGTSYSDCDLYPDVEYRYSVVPVDAVGNVGGVVDGQPVNASDENAPAAPAIVRPVEGGETYQTDARRVDIDGLAEGGSRVVLLRDGFRVAETKAAGTPVPPETVNYETTGTGDLALSPDAGKLAVARDDGSIDVIAWPSLASLARYDAMPGQIRRFTWMDEQRLLVGSIESGSIVLRILSVTEGAITELARKPVYSTPQQLELYIRRDIGAAVLAAINGSYRDAQISLFDLETGVETVMVNSSSTEVHEFIVSPDGEQLLWRGRYGSVVTRPGEPARLVDCPGSPAGWWGTPATPLMVNAAGLFICDEQGNAEVIDPRVTSANDIFNHRSYPSGTRLVAFGPDQGGERELIVVDGEGLEIVGHVAHDGPGAPVPEGFMDDGRVWFEYSDAFSGVRGMEMTPPMTNFRFDGVSVNEGLNEFTAYAVDRFGNQGNASLPIVVEHAGTEITNLSVTLDVREAIAEGYPLPISVIVENRGNQATPTTDLEIGVFTAGGQQIALASELVPALAPDESHRIQSQWSASGAGVAVIEARVDAGMTVPEDNESDNYVTTDVRVTADQVPSLSLSGDVSGAPGAPRHVGWALANPAQRDYQGELVLSVVSQEGTLIEEVSRIPVTIAAGESVSGDQSFTVPALQPGEYRLDLVYQAPGLDAPISAQGVLRVERDLRISASLSGTASNYAAQQAVPLAIDLEHIGVSGVLESGELAVTLVAPDGTDVDAWQRPVATLLPGDSQRHSIDWNTGVTPPGDYRFDVTLNDGQGAPVLQRQRSFTIDGGVPVLSGQLSSASDLVGQGKPLPVEWSITNDGNMPLADARVRIDARAGNGSVVTVLGTLGDLPVGGSLGEAIELDTTALEMGRWTLELLAEVDIDGGSREYRLASLPVEVRDITGPRVSLVSPAPDSTINGAAALLAARADDGDSGVAALEWRADAGAWSMMSLAGDRYQVGLATLAEGEHVLEVRARDLSGNLSSPLDLTVRIDNTSPAIQIGGVQGGVFYDAAVQPTATVNDASAVTVTRRLNGLPWSGEPVVAERVHELVVAATDAAGNFRRSSVLFTIDTTAPSIAIDGVEDGGLYNTAVTPHVSVFDANPDETTLTLDGAPYTQGTPVSGEGEHSLSVRARDRAGNVSTSAVGFTIDTTAPVPPQVTSIADGQVLDHSIIDVAGTAEPFSDVALTFNGTTRTALADGAGHFLFPAVPFLEGDNTIVLTATDAAGNTSESASLTFTVQTDVEPPELRTTGVEDGDYYASAVSVGVEITDESAIVSRSITINGSPYTPGSVIEMDGDYELRVEAEDEYGNRAQASLSFAIDTGAPRIIIGAVAAGGAYNHEVTPTVSVDDDSPTDVTMTLDGAPWAAGTPVVGEGRHTLRVEAVDAAGNAATETVSFTLDFTPPAAPVIETPGPGEVVRGPDVTLSGNAEAGTRVDIALAGTGYTVDVPANGRFEVTASLADGNYTLSATATDRAGNSSAATALEFQVLSTVVILDTDQQPPEPRVLLWEAAANARPPREESWYLASLRRAGITVTVVQGEQAFLEELDTGEHNVLLLTSPGGEFGPPLRMSHETIMRIRGSVAGGYGLAWINTMPNLVETWHDIVGARTVSVLSHAGGVDYVLDEETVVSSAYTGRASGVYLLGATAEGQVQPDCDAGIDMWLLCSFGDPDFASAITHDYGRGRVKMLTFEPDGLDDQAVADQVMRDLVSDVSPDVLMPLPGLRTPQTLGMERNIPGEQLDILITVPEGLTLFPAEDAERIDDRTARWRVEADVLQTRVRYSIRGDEAGTYPVSVQVTSLLTGEVLEETRYDFVLAHSMDSLIEAIRQRIDAEQGGHRVMLKLVEKWFERAVDASERGDREHAAGELYKAMFKLRLSPDYDRELMALLGDFQRVLEGAGE